MIAAPTTQHVIVASQEGVYPNYAKTSSTCLGIFHLIISAVLFVISIAAVAILGNYGSTKSSMVSTLIFTVLYVAAGICAIVAGRHQKRGVVIASMVLSIITSIVAICTVIALAVAISVVNAARTERNRYPSLYYRSEYSDLYTTALVILYLCLFIYLAQAIVSVWLSAIGCSVSCCGSHSAVNQPVAMAAPAMAPMHVVQPMQQGPYVVQGAYPAYQPQGAYPMNQPQGAYPMNQPQEAYPMNQQQGPGPMLADAKPPL